MPITGISDVRVSLPKRAGSEKFWVTLFRGAAAYAQAVPALKATFGTVFPTWRELLDHQAVLAARERGDRTTPSFLSTIGGVIIAITLQALPTGKPSKDDPEIVVYDDYDRMILADPAVRMLLPLGTYPQVVQAFAALGWTAPSWGSLRGKGASKQFTFAGKPATLAHAHVPAAAPAVIPSSVSPIETRLAQLEQDQAKMFARLSAFLESQEKRGPGRPRKS